MDRRYVPWFAGIAIGALIGVVALTRSPPSPSAAPADGASAATAASTAATEASADVDNPNPESASSAVPMEQNGAFATYIGLESIKALKANLRNPDTAKFSDVWVESSYVEGKPILFTCGKVNAENGFGGFTGPIGFIGFASNVMTAEDAGYADMWNSTCAIGKQVVELHP